MRASVRADIENNPFVSGRECLREAETIPGLAALPPQNQPLARILTQPEGQVNEPSALAGLFRVPHMYPQPAPSQEKQKARITFGPFTNNVRR